MKLVISGTAYDLQGAMEEANLNDLYAMLAQTGMGISSLGASLEKVDTSNPFAMDDPKVFQALRCLIFLAKRHAGVPCTVETANNFPFSELEFVADESDAPAEDTDPTQGAESTGSAPVGAPVPA